MNTVLGSLQYYLKVRLSILVRSRPQSAGSTAFEVFYIFVFFRGFIWHIFAVAG